MVYVSGSLPTGGEDEGAWEESAAFFLENGAIDTFMDMQALVLIKPLPSVGHPPQQTSHPLAWFPFWVGLKLSPAGWRPDHRAFI